MVSVTISLSEELYNQLAAQAREVSETPEQVAADILSERFSRVDPSPEFQAMVARQLLDYRKAFDRLAE